MALWTGMSPEAITADTVAVGRFVQVGVDLLMLRKPIRRFAVGAALESTYRDGRCGILNRRRTQAAAST